MFDPEECDWLSNIKEDSLGTFTYDGKIYGIPYSTAGIGLVYNKTVLDEAVGGDFDPATIKTRSNLEELFQRLKLQELRHLCLRA